MLLTIINGIANLKSLDPLSVYSVRTLEEATKSLCPTSKYSLKTDLRRWFLLLWLPAVNFLLWFFRCILFSRPLALTEGIRNIVVYTVGIVGDNVVLLPALAALRKQYPLAAITVIVNCQTWSQEGAEGIIGRLPYKDRLLILDDHPVQRKGFKFFTKDPQLKELACDLFVNLSPFGNRGWLGAVIREMILARKLGARSAVGFKMATYSRRSIFNKVQYRFVKNEPRRSREVLAELGLIPLEHEDLLTKDDEVRRIVQDRLIQIVKGKPFFVINPGAKFKAKCWPSDRFGAIAAYLGKKYGIYSVVSGTKEEADVAEHVVRSSEGYSVSLAGQTSLQELTELLRLAEGCVTNDTGTMHMAAMVGIPTVALFSMRHSPTHWFPLSKQDNVIALFITPDCKFCYNDYCEQPICLTQIEPDHVIKALEGFLSAP